ncbi:MAG: hypothetical protein ACO32J_03430 [Phycisphaerales bacterium]|jgi:hypothetical protein
MHAMLMAACLATQVVQDRPMTADGAEQGIGAPAEMSGDWYEEAVEGLKQFHCVESPDGGFRLNSDFWFTQNFMVFDQPPPSLVRTGQHQLYYPKVSGLVSMEFGDQLSLVALGQAYRQFDPADMQVNANLDEYFAVWQPLDTPALMLKGGTFATCFGQWINRHFSFQNPLINAPLMYEAMTTVTDGANGGSATPGRGGFLGRRNAALNYNTWVPIVWGPSYASGGQIGGSWRQFDYALELKNASLSSRPSEWQFWDRGFAYPTLTGRVGWRPDAAWNLGVSGSGGSYVSQDPTVTGPINFWDTTQTVVGADISWAHGSLEMWAEAAWSRYRVPNLGPADVWSYFVEARWKFAPQWWLAGRWNQQLYGSFDNVTPPGGTVDWDNDLWRVDVCLGWKINRYLQFKAQYSYLDQDGFEQQSPNLFAIQLVMEF